MPESSNSKETKCPSWAEVIIDQLRQVEVFLGHIPKTSDWGAEFLKNVNARTFSPEGEVFDEDKAHMIFVKICKDLAEKEQLSAADIAIILNERIGYAGGPAYCDTSEVQEALDS